ncbi:hypothetical protein NIES2101_41620 [Calothrix sp. HK-06]|nr:hypothetical protein NIES2101_41620 [Calothrix sp. HK-06]
MVFLAAGVIMTQTAAFASPTAHVPNKVTTKLLVVKVCYYASQKYSEGSVIKGSDGVQVQCVGDRCYIKYKCNKIYKITNKCLESPKLEAPIPIALTIFFQYFLPRVLSNKFFSHHRRRLPC